MTTPFLFSEQGMTSILFILSTVLTFVGVILWTGRNMWGWSTTGIANYLAWERGTILAGIVAVMLGLMLLEGMLARAGDPVMARLGLGIYFVAGILGIMAESYEISRHDYLYATIVVYVVLAFLGQAAFGVSLLRTGLLPAWVGWATIVWNLFWLVLLPIVTPRDIYYPVLFYPIPLLMALTLWSRR